MFGKNEKVKFINTLEKIKEFINVSLRLPNYK